MGVPRLGDAALAAALAGSVLRGREAEVVHEWARVVEAVEIAELGDEGDGAG